jgi:signal recognition particle subunit SRP54
MLDSLSEKLKAVLDGLKKKGKLTRGDVEEGLREMRRVLLEADVNYKVAKRFTERLREKALGEEVLDHLTPGHQVVKIVRDELTRIMGGEKAELDLSTQPSVVMLVGLQGSGKTTTAGKLAKHLKKNALLVATDVRRPAAGEQLKQVSEQVGCPVFTLGKTSLKIGKGALEYARKNQIDVVILDTAGRLQIDEELMKELEMLKRELKPAEILLVADAMTGQEATNIAEEFHRRLNLTGIILTKLDGDARGGAALSMVEVTGIPIKYIGVGEKLDEFEVFHPDRMAQRILGMGDVLGLIEEAEKLVDLKRAEELERKIRQDSFTLQDFLEQIKQMSKVSLSRLLEKIPGMRVEAEIDEGELKKIEAIINSMTLEERLHPEIIGGSRKKRIARGSGRKVREVNQLLKQFTEAKKLMKQIGKMDRKLIRNFPFK